MRGRRPRPWRGEGCSVQHRYPSRLGSPGWEAQQRPAGDVGGGGRSPGRTPWCAPTRGSRSRRMAARTTNTVHKIGRVFRNRCGSRVAARAMTVCGLRVAGGTWPRESAQHRAAVDQRRHCGHRAPGPSLNGRVVLGSRPNGPQDRDVAHGRAEVDHRGRRDGDGSGPRVMDERHRRGTAIVMRVARPGVAGWVRPSISGLAKAACVPRTAEASGSSPHADRSRRRGGGDHTNR